MKVIKTYQCEACGRTFPNEETCATHEKRHISPVKIKWFTASHFSHPVPGGKKDLIYPWKVAVTLSDGSEGQYELTSVRTVKREEDESHGKD